MLGRNLGGEVIPAAPAVNRAAVNASLVGGGNPASPDVSRCGGGLEADDHFLRAAALAGTHQHPVHLGIGFEFLIFNLYSAVSLGRSHGTDQHAASVLVSDQYHFIVAGIGLGKRKGFCILHQRGDQPFCGVTSGNSFNVTCALVEQVDVVEIHILITEIVEDALHGEGAHILETLQREGVLIRGTILAVGSTSDHGFAKGCSTGAGFHRANELAALGPDRVVFTLSIEKGGGNGLGWRKTRSIDDDFTCVG